MSSTTPKFDIYLGDKAAIQGYRVKSFSRDSAPLVSPKFSTGAEGQTDLDLLKAVSINDLSGGMFQRDWVEPTKVARSLGFFNPQDRNFYPAPAPAASVQVSGGDGVVVAKAENELYSYIAFGRFISPNWISTLYKLTKATGALTQITLPAAFATASTYICDIGFHKEFIYISTQGSPTAYLNNYRMKISDNTFQNIGGYGVIMRELRGIMYHIEVASNIYAMSNETAAGVATYTAVDIVGLSNPYESAPTDAQEMNSALWIAKPDGIFRFDGVRSVKVLNLRTRKLHPYNGALYFVANNWLYKFDGTNVTRVQFFGQAETFSDFHFSSNADYLFIQTAVLNASYATTDQDAPAIPFRRIYAYDGQAFSLMLEEAFPSTSKGSSTAILYTFNTLMDIVTYGANFGPTTPIDIYTKRFDLETIFKTTNITTSSRLEVTSSEFDAGFPNIYKTLNAIEINHSKMITGDTITVKYQIFNGKSWGSWITLGTVTSTSPNYLELSTTEMLFKRVKFTIVTSLAASSTISVRSLGLRYTVQPRHRFRWQLTLLAYGMSMTDRWSDPTTDSANTLSNLIIKSLRQKTPTYLLSPDHGKVKTTVNAAATSIVIAGQPPVYTDPYDEYPMIAIKNANGVWEILRLATATYNAGNDDTTITVLERGYLGITAAQLSANAEFHLCHRVFVNRLMRENTILDENTYDEQVTGDSQIQREFVLEVIEA